MKSIYYRLSVQSLIHEIFRLKILRNIRVWNLIQVSEILVLEVVYPFYLSIHLFFILLALVFLKKRGNISLSKREVILYIVFCKLILIILQQEVKFSLTLT